MSAVGDARKRQTETVAEVPMLTGREKQVRDWLREQPGGAEVWLTIKAGFRRSYDLGLAADSERADILAELAEIYAALNATTADITRLAAELHTAHGQIDRARKLADDWDATSRDRRPHLGCFDMYRHCSQGLLSALDGGSS